MNADALVAGKQYYFYEKIKKQPVRVSRGRFLGIFTNSINPLYSYLIKSRFEIETRKNVTVYTPLKWYIKFETLDDVFSNTRLPTEVVNIIESYL
jgi:hypothetical protein